MFHVNQLLILLVGICAFAFGAKPAREPNILTFKGNGFHFEMVVHSMKSADQLFQLLSSDSATLNLRGSARSVTISAGKIETVFQAFGYKAVTITEKTVESDRKIRVSVKSFKHNWKVVPQVKSGEGVYLFEQDSTGSKVVYSQDVVLDRPISWLTQRLIRWQLNPFARDLRRVCHNILLSGIQATTSRQFLLYLGNQEN